MTLFHPCDISYSDFLGRYKGKTLLPDSKTHNPVDETAPGKDKGGWSHSHRSTNFPQDGSEQLEKSHNSLV